MPRRAVLAVIIALLAVSGGAASASARLRIDRHLLWSTVNVCDTRAHPHTIGLRGSMPGAGGRRTALWMRFLVQYWSGHDHRWHQIVVGGISPWQQVGDGRYRARQAGRMFAFVRPAHPTLLRGAIEFEWRRGARVLEHVRRATTAGHRSAAGADPPGYTAATCRLS